MVLTVFAMMAMGCTQNFIQAPYDAVLSVPSDVTLGWNDGLNRFDLSGVPIIMNFAVTDSAGFPLENIAVDVLSGWGGVYLLPEEAVELVGYPGVPDNIQNIDDVREACQDESGNYALVEDWCAWFWDAGTNQFYSFSGTYADNFSYTDSGGFYYFAPNFATIQTNRYGIATVVAFVDFAPTDGTSFGTVELPVSIGLVSGTASIAFTGESAESSTDTSR
jgi:hypothetical protein